MGYVHTFNTLLPFSHFSFCFWLLGKGDKSHPGHGFTIMINGLCNKGTYII